MVTMSEDRRGVGAEAVLLAGVLGGLAGAALGLLLAPRTGAETRSEWGERAKTAGEKARELADLACDKAEEALAAAKRWREEVMAKAEEEEAAEAVAAAAEDEAEAEAEASPEDPDDNAA
jgi:gas vesicle protein